MAKAYKWIYLVSYICIISLSPLIAGILKLLWNIMGSFKSFAGVSLSDLWAIVWIYSFMFFLLFITTIIAFLFSIPGLLVYIFSFYTVVKWEVPLVLAKIILILISLVSIIVTFYFVEGRLNYIGQVYCGVAIVSGLFLKLKY
ncbi:hypothetical protein [Myroides indicus]|uniref:Uncharacterized protein n=1 Tax=Myroides indicus TaxID=1323422 RepID=A0A4R7EXN0_9FLAO|nr:hypothetical protein [Myroides indicus]TDS53970.1 hypothetical protein C8P70_1262 [Myroides indicus]